MVYPQPQNIEIITDTSSKLYMVFYHQAESFLLLVCVFMVVMGFGGLHLIFTYKLINKNKFKRFFEALAIWLFFRPVFFLFGIYLIHAGIKGLTNNNFESHIEVTKTQLKIQYKNLTLEYVDEEMINLSKTRQFYVKKKGLKWYGIFVIDEKNKEKEIELHFGGISKDDYLFVCEKIEQFLKIKDKPIKDEIK